LDVFSPVTVIANRVKRYYLPSFRSLQERGYKLLQKSLFLEKGRPKAMDKIDD